MARRTSPDTGWPLDTGAPFHLEATVRLLQRRPTNRVDIWENGCHRRALSTPDGIVLVETRNVGSVDEPNVRFAIRNRKPPRAARGLAAASIRRMFGLDVDPTPVQRLAEHVTALRSTALALRGMRPPRFPSLFEAFGSVIPFQQLSLDAGMAIVGRLVDRFGAVLELEERRWLSFPEPEAVARADIKAIQSVGLSRKKAETLRRSAERISSRELTEEDLDTLSTPNALAVLTALPGIGPWTAAVILLRGLGRTDVFPPNDAGVARGLGALLGLKPGRTPAAMIERFGEHRGYLYFYSLGAQLLGRGLIDPAPGARRSHDGPATIPVGRKTMTTKRFRVGDHVTWNSEAGRVTGRIIKVHTKDTEYKGYTHHASRDDPQYEIQSDKTDHIAMHKGPALKKVTARKQESGADSAASRRGAHSTSRRSESA